jgi:hypothetical protein
MENFNVFEYDNNLNDGFESNPSLEGLFEKVKAKEEELLRKRREEIKKNEKGYTAYHWVKYIMYFWVARMAVVLAGSLLPMFIAICKNHQLFHLLFSDYGSLNILSSSNLFSAKTENNLSLLSEFEWKVVSENNFQLLRSDMNLYKVPYLIKSSPIIHNSTLKLFLFSLFQTSTDIKLKVSESSQFSYYSDDRLWSNDKVIPRNYNYITISDYFNVLKYQFPSFPLIDFMKSHFQKNDKESSIQLKDSSLTSKSDSEQEKGSSSSSSTCVGREDEDQQCSGTSLTPEVSKSLSHSHYMYIAYPNIVSYLETFAPSLSSISKSLYSTEPQCNLWITSPNVIATMHYDYQDNYLLQLSGNKEILIVSPEALSYLLPYPSFHPLWRQASRKNITVESLIYHLDDLKKGEEASSSLLSSVSHVKKGFQVWKAILQPGDMIYIPSGYYHQVISGENSISLNTWFPSVFSEVHLKLSKLSLPFLLTDSLSLKVSKVAIIMKELCGFLHESPDCLGQQLISRYQVIFEQMNIDDKQCSSNLIHLTKVCNPMNDLRTASKFQLVLLFHLSLFIVSDFCSFLFFSVMYRFFSSESSSCK